MEVGKSFTYMFEDKEWISKLAIGGLVTLLSVFLIPIPLLIGYALQVIKNVAEGNTTPLPEWKDLGDLYVKGLTALVGALVWAIPAIIIACCLGIAQAVFANAAEGSSRGVGALGGLVLVCLYCVLLIVGLAINLLVYAPLTNFALNNQINTFWDFAGTWRYIKANPSNYITAFLLALVANFIAGFGTIACFIGVFFTSFWALLVAAHLFGQVARANMPPMDSTNLPPTPPMDEPPSFLDAPVAPVPTA